MKPHNSAGPSPNKAGTQSNQPNCTAPFNHSPLPPHLRCYPADSLVCLAVSALLWDTGRARLQELRLGPEAFEDEAAAFAAVLMTGRDFTPAEVAKLYRDDGEHLPWGRAIDMFTLDAKWAEDIIDKFALAYASRWMPKAFRWAADRMERDRWPADRVAPEVDRMLTLVRPALLAAEGRAA